MPTDLEDLYERITRLLGKPTDGKDLKRFIQETDSVPISTSSDAITLPELGISLLMWEGLIGAVYMHVSTVNTLEQGGILRPYPGTFAAGITSRDNNQMVQRKLGAKPLRSREIPNEPGTSSDLSETYELPTERLSFKFSGITGEICFASVSTKEFGKFD